MPRYVVVLQASLNGSPALSTRDVIEADTADDAEAKAIAAWQQLEPRLTFQPLLTIQQR